MKWVRDDNWRPKTSIRTGTEQPIPAPANVKPERWLCWKCPKKSPEQAPKFELSFKNLKALAAYRRIRAVPGCLTKRERRDQLLLRNMAMIDTIVRNHESHRAALAMLEALPAAVASTVTRQSGRGSGGRR